MNMENKMIGFRMDDNNQDNNSSRPEEKEMPAKKPEIEIKTPSPAVIPTPQPDQIISIPEPEIIESPIESPSTDISEIGTSEIMEF
jgi:hypothetical protein